MRADKEHDEGEVQEVVEDEVRADGTGEVDDFGGGGEEVGGVEELEGEEDEPGGDE